ncbi:uncharacterized protein N7500_010808 [Penicillium coprophilum]|uniref:uncharacterized protein n=1 Tax=Penicillium coprophilum TaxID=36646 RepID=UPI00238F9EE3|nr:uncharacterized protein N7500_010808 [Penicillium coprophilum]KAJ5150619.1 hypothetical protein N7500_010808 [Penicillium coprophilum]
MSPIELPPSTSKEVDRRQSHDYPNMTKGNPIQGKVFNHQSFPPPTPHTHPIVSRDIVKCNQRREGIGHKPLSNCFYGGAFPQCLTWYFGFIQSAGCPGTFSQSKIEKRAKLPFVREL